jgi:predicted ArsR family transcriptional regulator
MSTTELGKAMSSRSRLQILDLLSRKPMSIEELSREVSLKTITVRHHVNMLKRIGLVEEYGEERRKIGRPVLRYRSTQKPVSIQYPKRQYELLSRSLIHALIDSLGREKAGEALTRIGRDVGESLAKELTNRNGVSHWDLEELKKHIVEEHLSEVGAIPEVVEYDSKKIRFRMHNCVFYELAREYPDLICEKLDEGLMESLLKGTLGKAHVDQTKCVVHKDAFCEYVIRTGK